MSKNNSMYSEAAYPHYRDPPTDENLDATGSTKLVDNIFESKLNLNITYLFGWHASASLEFSHPRDVRLG